ncbi:MAG TPA: ABC transporter substrate-binding protein, partial [Candidatus Binatus sp.]|nr:ABC transporter substrate-binding protein [Candidatus Binatus sp.]
MRKSDDVNQLRLSTRPLAANGSERRRASVTAIARCLSLIFICLLLVDSPACAQELKRVLYGVSTSYSHLPVWVAKDAGLFAKNGLDIEPVQIRGGQLSTMTIMSGQAVLSGVGAGSVVAARVEGGDILLLACPADLEPVYLIARPEIKSAADLKGKAAGVTRLNSSIHFY